MDKKPRIPISEEPVEIWYESPSVMIVKKPRGMAVHPETESEEDTLLNRLFQSNRWLADMETSLKAGVLHLFEQQDHGLMVFNKADDYTESLEKAFAEQKVDFSYIVHVEGDVSEDSLKKETDNLKIKAKQTQAGWSSFDIETKEGNTAILRRQLFPDGEKETVYFYCYAIGMELPHSGEKHVTSLRETATGIPRITVYHAPP